MSDPSQGVKRDGLTDRANMIGDISRTGTYRKAILGNAAVAFKDKVVLDLGAGESLVEM